MSTTHLYRHPDGATHGGQRCTNNRCFPPRHYDCIVHRERHPLTPECIQGIAEWGIDHLDIAGGPVTAITDHPDYQKAYNTARPE